MGLSRDNNWKPFVFHFISALFSIDLVFPNHMTNEGYCVVRPPTGHSYGRDARQSSAEAVWLLQSRGFYEQRRSATTPEKRQMPLAPMDSVLLQHRLLLHKS
jgi:hypothetical protein